MILAFALPPTPGEVVVGVIALLAGALIASTSGFLAWRTRNWLHHVGTAGGLLIVAGIVGQRTVAAGAPTGPWDAGLTVPVLGVRIDPVTAAGVVVALVGLTLTLLFERIPDPADRPRALVHRSLEDDDTV